MGPYYSVEQLHGSIPGIGYQWWWEDSQLSSTARQKSFCQKMKYSQIAARVTSTLYVPTMDADADENFA